MLKASHNKLPGHQKDREWSESFWFVVGADPQLGLEDHFALSSQGKRITRKFQWNIELERIEKLVDFFNNCHNLPRFLIICGDLVNAFPGGQQREEQEHDFIKAFQKLNKNIPLVCVCGNHDVGNSPTVETLSSYRNTFGDDYFSFWISGTFHIVINSQYFEDDSNCCEESKLHSKWLDEQLKLASTAKHAFAYQHIPPFLVHPDEDKQYFNLEHGVRKSLLEKLSKAGISKLFCGHYHNNAGGWYPSDSNKRLEVVVTTAIGCQLGSDTILPGLEGCWPKKRVEPSIRLVTVDSENTTHELKRIEDLVLTDERS